MNSKGQKEKSHCFETYDDLGRCLENKSKRPRTDEADNEVEKFFTLVGRIHALNKHCEKKGTNSTSVLFMEEIVSSGVDFNGKPPWKPVFQQEDFCDLSSKGSPCEQQKDPTSSIYKIPSGSGVSLIQSIGNKKLMGLENFDLNVEAISDQPGSEVLELFS